jgi:hypothetical protein
MFILMNLLLIGIEFHPTNLATIHNKLAVGIRVFGCDKLSLVWQPCKHFALGLEGNVSYDDDNDTCIAENTYAENTYSNKNQNKTERVGLRFYNYFRTGSSFSPFISLSPYFQVHYYHYKYTNTNPVYSNTYDDTSNSCGATLSPGAEYFFTLGGKQLSLKLIATLIDFSRTYTNGFSYSSYGNDSTYIDGVENSWHFYSPTEMSVDTWLCLHF